MADSLTMDRLYERPENLIADEAHRELECEEYLRAVPDFLCKGTVVDERRIQTQYTSHAGIADFIISARVKSEDGTVRVQAFVWELKAPQCYIFEEDTRNRLCPSDDLLKAENQLLNYCHELKGSDSFRSEFGITHPDYVRFGGIIIGSKRKLVRGRLPEDAALRMYGIASRIREKCFYDPNGIRLVTWDTIREQLRTPLRWGGVEKGDEYLRIEVPTTAEGIIQESVDNRR